MRCCDVAAAPFPPSTGSDSPWPGRSRSTRTSTGERHPRFPRPQIWRLPWSATRCSGSQRWCWISTPTKALVDGHLGRRGAGGNRTPVHQV